MAEEAKGVQTMSRITVFVGSARKGHTYDAAQAFLAKLATMADIEGEIVQLSRLRVELCRGCKVCFERGEAHCPLKDDRDTVLEKMMASDGVVIATPNYAFQVSAFTKAMLDRLAFIYHRPRFFGKSFTSIVAQGIYGGKKIVDYLDFAGAGMGFKTVKGTVLMTIDPMTERQQDKNDAALERLARQFHNSLTKPPYPTPTLMELFMFRMSRTKVRLELEKGYSDYDYYADRGWFDAGFYYPTRLGPLKRGAGRLFDWVSAAMTQAR